ncbi:hypothetical protein BD309DRAFT_1016114 [Dichomitus squalens]|uniref:Uncharacterized protein n=1 Tax=Dichomitus squalens TaxID=114155 RepID=A0A4Q9P2D6_9APHY|nr:hypothetical protein BD311DRAFT_668923 [Dichomitus squalens]TBU47685.1 hypothetical protein BD309DRAFT_1016114 [Dichomitus squalens]
MFSITLPVNAPLTNRIPAPQSIRDNGEVVEDSERLSETSFQWAGYGAPAGSTVIIYVTDTAGDGASTAPVVVSPSSDSSCLDPGF